MTFQADVLTVGETMMAINPADGSQFTLEQPFVLSPAGAESNVAAGCALLGHRAAWVSHLSKDPLGKEIAHYLAGFGVDTSLVKFHDDAPTGVMFKLPEAGATRVVYYRTDSAATQLSVADLPDLGAVKVVHFSGITAALSASCLQLCTELVNLPPDQRPFISFDVNYRPALWESLAQAQEVILELARHSDAVFVGRDEAEIVWGAATADQISTLLGPVPHLVVKDADIEATEFQAGVKSVVPAQTVEVVEPVGAGDAFVAGWLSAFLTGGDALARLKKGHAMAAVVLGSATDLPPDPHNFQLKF